MIHKVFQRQNKISTWGFGFFCLSTFISCFFVSNHPNFYFSLLIFVVYFGIWMIKTIWYSYDSCGCDSISGPALIVCNRLFNERKILSCINCTISLTPKRKTAKIGKYLILSLERRDVWWNLEPSEIFRK